MDRRRVLLVHPQGHFEESRERMDCMNTVFLPGGLTAARREGLFFEFSRSYYMRPRTLRNSVNLVSRSPDGRHGGRRFLAHAGGFLKFARANRRSVK
jgi:hypothetical protein